MVMKMRLAQAPMLHVRSGAGPTAMPLLNVNGSPASSPQKKQSRPHLWEGVGQGQGQGGGRVSGGCGQANGAGAPHAIAACGPHCPLDPAVPPSSSSLEGLGPGAAHVGGAVEVGAVAALHDVAAINAGVVAAHLGAQRGGGGPELGVRDVGAGGRRARAGNVPCGRSRAGEAEARLSKACCPAGKRGRCALCAAGAAATPSGTHPRRRHERRCRLWCPA